MADLLDRNSKEDTRLFVDRDGGGAAALAEDRSQWRADLTNSTTYLTSTDTRLAIRSPREISVVISIASGDSRTILNWGNTAGTVYIYRLGFSGGVVQFGHNDATLATLAPPNLAVAARSYLLHYSTEYDVRAATYYSEMAVCDLATGTWITTRATHSQPNAAVASQQFNLSGYGAGSNLFTGGLSAYSFVRVGGRFHSTTEAKEDWYAESSAPTVTGVQPTVELVPWSTSYFTENPAEELSDAMLDAGTVAGPAEFSAALVAWAGRKRLYSPLVNLVPRAPDTLDNTYSATSTWLVGSGYYGNVGMLFVVVVPKYADRVNVRVHVQAWLAAGAPGGSAVSVSLALYRGGFGDSWAQGGTSSTITDNHTSSGTGQWYSFAAFASGPAMLLAYKFGTGTGASYLRAKIKAITIEPYEAA